MLETADTVGRYRSRGRSLIIRRSRRWSRRLRWPGWATRRRTVIVLACVAACLAAGLTVQAIRSRGRPVRVELAESLALLEAGNFSAARYHAQAAIKSDPGSGLAHAVLARAFLAIGDGDAAEGELRRATDAGLDPARTHQLLAHALLLQHDPAAALDEASQATPRFGGYALRIAARALAMQGDQAGAEATLATVLAVNPRDAHAWVDLGRIRYTGGDVAAAIDAAGRALALRPGDPEALTLRGELVRTQYGLVAALPWFEAALKRDAYYHPALIEYAATLGDAGRYTDMLAATRRALAARPDSAQAFYLQAVLAARAGRFDLARAMMLHTAGQIDDMPGALLLAGTLAYQAGAYEQAIERWRELVAQQPMNVTARRVLGAALLKSGDPRGALDVLRPVALRSDADSYTLALVGRAFERTGERDWSGRFLDRAASPAAGGTAPFGIDDSLPVLTSATSQAPDDPVQRLGYVRGLVDAGHQSTALAQARLLVSERPAAPAAYLALGDVLAAAGQSAGAATAFRQAATLRFDEPTMLRLVEALEAAGDRTGATRALSLFLSQHPGNLTASRLAAHWQIANDDWDHAVATLNALRHRIGNRDAALLAELALAYAGRDDDDTGVAFGRAAYALAPLNPVMADAYGWALYQAGRTGAAVQLLEKAVALAPVSTVRWHLGQAYADSGRKADAGVQIRAALADPRFTDREAATAVLKTLG